MRNPIKQQSESAAEGAGSAIEQPSERLLAQSSPTANSTQSASYASLDVHALRRTLEQRIPLTEAPDESSLSTPASQTAKTASHRPIFRRMSKAVLGCAVIAVFGLIPLRTLLQTSSVEAVVNARVVTLRAPIAGEITATPADLSRSNIVPQGTPLLHVINLRTDRGQLNELRRQLGRLANERISISAKLRSAQKQEDNLAGQAEQFRRGRIEQLEARTAELESLIAVATARREEAIAAQERATALARSGTVSTAELARLTRDATAASQAEVATRHRLAAAGVELKAARTGIFLGDSYNDRPSSVQRGDEVRQRIADLSAERDTLDAELERLRSEVTDETTQYQNLSDVTMTLPVAGRIWEVLVSPGEQVRVGQDLVRLIDCSATLVTANVTEAVYNRLSVGSSARFLPADGGNDLAGTVVNLTGLAGAPANLAIEPSALSKEPYRVTLAVPNPGTQQACGVGRTGRVVFGDSETKAN